MIEFAVTGSPRNISRAIEDYARASGRVNALVVPWEGDAVTLVMAVTSVKADGWAIEHTDLGTIRLTDLGSDSTAVAIVARDPDSAGRPELTALFDRFATQLQRHLTLRPGQTGWAGQP
jgi:hypothetical protein